MERRKELVLDELQKGIPITKRPFLEISKKLGIPEEEIVSILRELKRSGIIRRFGGVFDSKKMGYKGVLCAMKVPKGMIEDVAEFINQFPEVTHNYERDGEINLWFTITAKDDERMEEIKKEIEKEWNIEVLTFPAVKTYKINLFLPMSEDG